ncbi:MAG: hypothetical protein AAF718_10930 [Pseudomonadota bacterium]
MSDQSGNALPVHRVSMGKGWRGIRQKAADGKAWPKQTTAPVQFAAGFSILCWRALRAPAMLPYFCLRSFA